MRHYPHILAVIFLIFFILLGLNPIDRSVWIVEVIPVVAVYLLLISTYKSFRFSNLSYTLMSLWLFWHTIGGHYTFANVPFDFITELFHFERNHFDRIGHIVVGFYAYPMVEFLVRKHYTNKIVASFFGLFFILSGSYKALMRNTPTLHLVSRTSYLAPRSQNVIDILLLSPELGLIFMVGTNCFLQNRKINFISIQFKRTRILGATICTLDILF